MKILSFYNIKKPCFFFVLFVVTSLSVYAQPSVLGSNVADVGNYVTYNITDFGDFRQQRVQAVNSSSVSVRTWEFTIGTAGSPNYTTNWRPYTSGNTLSVNTFIPVGFANGARYNTSSGGASGLLPAITSGNYYTFNVSENSAADNVMQLLETSYSPVTISAVAQSPTGSFVNAAIAPTITATISSALSSGEGLFIRWSTDISFSSSTIVAMTGSGTTYTGVIPAQGAGTTIYYYILSSNKTESQLNSDKSTYGESAFDMGTLNLKTLVQSGSGNTNYSYTTTSNPVVVNSTGGTASASYATLKAAFDAINAGTHTSVITTLIEGNTTETTTATINESGTGSASYTSISMQPAGGAFTVNGSILGNGIIHFNGADNVTINGINTGGNSLSISNSSTSSSSNTCAVRFTNDAANNTIQNSTISGSSTSNSGGVIVFGDGAIFGNNNNTITTNTITAEGSNLPLFGIYSNEGVSPGNNGNIISNNNISDFFSATTSSTGIYLNAANDAWTISGNKFFQTATRTTSAAGIIHRAIYIVSGGGYTVSGNTIGYANSSGTGTTTYTSATTATYVGIDLSLASITSSSITGNTIAGISFTTTANTTGSKGIFSGIAMTTGLASVTNNIIGVISTGPISVVSNISGSSGIVVQGIYFNVATNSITVSGNTITALSASSSNANTGFAVYPIVVSGTGVFTVSSNTIGDVSTANSISAGTSPTTTAICSIRGIFAIATGGMTITGNTIQNCSAFGTGSSFFIGINTTTLASGTLDINNNNILNNTTAGTGGLQGILNTASVATLNITGNVLRNFTLSNTGCLLLVIANSGVVTTAININSNQLGNTGGGLITSSVASTGSITCISNSFGGSTAALSIQFNDIRGIQHTIAATSPHNYIQNTATTLSQNISNNTFTNLNVNTSGDIYFIRNAVSLTASGTKTINSNSISGTFAKTGSSGNVYFYLDNVSSAAGATINNNNNNFSNVTLSGSNILNGWSNSDGASATIKNVQNNTFSNITGSTGGLFIMQIANGTGSISGNTISNCTTQNTVTGLICSLGSFNINSNTITGLSSTSTSFASVTGISITGGTTQSVYQNTISSLSTTSTSSVVTAVSITGGTTVNIYKNKIYGLANNSTSFFSAGVVGINIGGGTTNTVYNNYIGDLTVSTVGISDAIRGIGVSSGSGTVNIYYNTVYLSGTSSGSGFGSSCIYSNTGPTLVLRNNIFVNLTTPTGSGLAIAYRRNGTTLTSYSSTSNNNLFYAGTPGASNLIYYDGSASGGRDRSLAEFQGRLSLSANGGGTRDIYSVTENPNFLSTTGSSSNFLNINTTIATYIESRGVNISGITDDYDGDIRQGNVGYVGTGTAPDIGADEFAGTSIACGTITVSSTGGSGAPSSCYLTLAAAVAAINGGSIHTGTITCSVPAGFTETAPGGGYQLTASGSSGNLITYIKSGAGANPTITTSPALTSGSLNDGIFKLIGADYTTIDGFTMQENSSNTTTTAASNNMTEWGVALLYTSTSNGAQNNTIQNCSISLNKTYTSTFGIYSNVRHSATAPTTTADIINGTTAPNSNNKIYSNTISNVNFGIAFIGSGTAANMDAGNDIGGSSSSTGNNISGWGGLAQTTGTFISNSTVNYGLFLNHQTSYNLSYNTLTSATGVSATTYNAIRLDYTVANPTGTFTNTVSNNTITMDGAGSTTFRCIDAGNGVNTMTLNITNNTLLNNNITGSSTSFSGILNSGIINTLNITGNIIRGTTSSATSGGFTGLSNTATVSSTVNINNNQIGDALGNAITFSAATTGTINGIVVSGGAGGPTINITGNNFQGISQSVIGSGAHNYINVSAFTASNNHNITGNTFTSLDANTSSDVYFIQDGSSMASSRSKNVSSNSISGSFIKRAGVGFSQVFLFSDGSAASSTSSSATFNSNDFSNITLNGNTYLGGWFTQDGSSIAKTIQNNSFRNISGSTNTIEVMTVRGSGSATISGNTIRGISGGGAFVTGLILGTGTQTASSNTIGNLTNSATSGVVRAFASTGTGTNTIQGNTIDSIYATGATSIAVAIDISAGSTTGVNISKNKIYDIANTTSTMNATDGAVNGIRVSAGSSAILNINNNLIGDLKATNASDATNVAVRGVNINASSGTTSTTNLFYNTIYLNTSGGTNFSSTAVYQFASSTTASFNLDMRNNILVNLSTPSGSGLTTAFRRSSNTSLNNYSTSSNNNLFYAGTPSSNRLIFTDGTTPQQTISSYISFMSTRDNASVTENVPFLSTVGSASNFLFVDATNPTFVESGGTTATISPTGDYAGDIRFGESGYSGTGTATDIGADEINGVNTSAYYFRTKSSGSSWKNAAYWEYSPDGVIWSDATSYPTSLATKINIRSGHTITIPSAVTANALQVDNGGILNQTNGFSLTISNGTGNDGSGYDFIVENGGIYVINGTKPVFNTGATAEIRTGGTVRADGNSSPNESDDFAYQTNATFRTGSIFQWNNSNAIQTSGLTYFQNSTTSDMPIFRVTASIGTNLGASSATTFNGKFECNSGTATWANSGIKTFRDGLGGTGTITHNSSCGTFSITGTNAVIDGSVTINIDNTGSTLIDLQIANGANCTISGSPTINVGTTTSTGALFTVDGTLIHNGTTPIDFKTGSGDFTVNGNYSGTGTLTLSNSTTDIIIGGTSGGSAGTFKFTTGSTNNTASSLTISRTGSGADMTLGSDFGVTNTMTLGTGTTMTLGSNTLTGNGTIAGAGTLTGSASSNLFIGGTGGSSFGTLLFTPGSQTLNNFTMGRSGSAAAVTLGTANNLTVGSVFDITNSAATVVLGSNTLTMNGTLTGAGTFTGSSSSNITVGGSSGGSLGTMQFAIGARTLSTLTISRTGIGANAILGSDLSINNLLDIVNSAATFSIGSNTLTLADATITGSGSLFGTTSSNLTMNGTGQVGTLRFASGGQLLNTLSLDRSLIVNDYAVLMASPLTVNALTLTNGIIATGANLFTWTRTGSLLPAAQTSYTANSTTYKNSYICLCDGTGNALSFTAPFDAADNIGFRVQNVGNNVWLPIGVDFDAPNRMWIDNSGSAPLGTTDDITVLLAKGDIGGTDKPVVRRIWYAYEGTPGGTKANMRLYFTKRDPSLFGISQDEVETGFDQTDVTLTQKDYGDPNYINVAQNGDILNASTNTFNTEVYGQYSIGISPDVNAATNGINQFSRFAVMNINSFILPVTITKVNAVLQQDASVHISWTSVQETNVDHYEVERSKDVIGFESIGRATARNTGALEQAYSLKDAQPLSGNNFYRIKIIEKDGKISYSNVVLVVNGSIAAVIKVQPNLISGSHTGIQFTNTPAGKFELVLYNMSGQQIWKQILQHGGGSAYYDLWLPASLPNGAYIMQIVGEGGLRLSQKIVVQQ